MVETMVGGVVVFDYDEDGDDDLFFVDGAPLPGYTGETPRSRLLRNDGGRFVDVTDRARLVVDGYGSGATAADVDGDGDRDLYVTCFGPNRLLRNQGDGTFVDATVEAGVGDSRWSASAGFADTDRDGDLDLYVADYVDFSLENAKDCREPRTGLVMYCHPESYRGVPDTFYRNRGDGTFEDATEAAGLGGDVDGAGLGVLFTDFDLDGWPDLYVANDTQPNDLYVNRGDGTFEDRSFLSGTAVNERGEPEAGMGVDAADVDGDGLPDLVVTNFERETNALYRNLGGGVFVDSRYPMRVAEASLPKLAFGVALADLDNDGDPDLAIANGHVSDNASDLDPSSRYAQANQVMENVGGRFVEVPDSGLDVVRPSRGLATGDLDGDGDLDLVIVNSDQPVEVYENVGDHEGAWLQVDLSAAVSAPQGIGARVRALAGDRRAIAEVRTASSYLSQSSLAVHLGLGAVEVVEALEVVWPSGERQRLEGLPARRRVRLRE
ncbi:MAG: CRTAC1 family protein [Thermoanaerobaculia bacterium]